jgi:SRSO17 transposase
VGIRASQQVYPADVHLAPPRRDAPGGRPATHPIPSAPSCTAAAMIAALGPSAFRRIVWRQGTQGPLAAAFAAVRVRVADGPRRAHKRHQPGAAAWLVCERRRGGERKFYLTNHPVTATRATLVRALKARWVCEQAHQQMKEELGLDHYEGRSWRGLHHHVLLSMIAFAFLQHWRLTHPAGGEKIRPAPRWAPAAADAPRRAPLPPRRRADRAPPMSLLPHPPHATAA